MASEKAAGETETGEEAATGWAMVAAVEAKVAAGVRATGATEATEVRAAVVDSEED